MKLAEALAKPLPADENEIGYPECFNPWNDVIHGIFGGYASESDDLMIEVLEAVRDRKTFELVEQKGFVAEFMLYVLAGHGLTEYGTSPRGAWPDMDAATWQALIDKWKAYRDVAWAD